MRWGICLILILVEVISCFYFLLVENCRVIEMHQKESKLKVIVSECDSH